MKDEVLDRLVERLRGFIDWLSENTAVPTVIPFEVLDAITALRAQVAALQAELERAVELLVTYGHADGGLINEFIRELASTKGSQK